MTRNDRMDQARRRYSEHPFPPYTYVSGHHPHPINHPQGHSFGQEPILSEVTDQNWPTNAQYLFGIDLFNFGYYWEAHEVWEGLWNSVGRSGTTADLLKALIHLAAAGVKVREDRPVGVERHLTKAATQLHTLANITPLLLGLDLNALSESATQLAQRQKTSAFKNKPEPVTPVLQLQLEPELADD